MKEDIKEVFPVPECKISNAILLLSLFRRQKLSELFLKNVNQQLNSECICIHCRNQSFPSIKCSKRTKKTFTTRTYYTKYFWYCLLLLPNNGMPKSAKIFLWKSMALSIKSFVVFSSRKWNFGATEVIQFLLLHIFIRLLRVWAFVFTIHCSK